MVDMVFLVFIGFLYLPLAWKVFEIFFGARKGLQMISFGGASVRFLFSVLLFCAGPKKSHKFKPNFPQDFPSVGSQGERF